MRKLKDKWVITDIDSITEDIDINSNIFKGEYFNRVIANGGDVVKSIKELSLTYDFLPSEKEMTIEKKLLDEYIADPYKGILN